MLVCAKIVDESRKLKWQDGQSSKDAQFAILKEINMHK